MAAPHHSPIRLRQGNRIKAAALPSGRLRGGPGGSLPYPVIARVSAPAALCLLIGVDGVRLLFLEAHLELLFDFRELIVFRLEVARMGPLKLGLQHAIDL